MVTPEKVEKAIRRIVEVSRPKKLILFGSYVRGEIKENSDLDVMVITGEEVQNSREESIRIRQALRGISMSMDILVITESRLKELGGVPGLIYYEALKEGEVVYQAA